MIINTETHETRSLRQIRQSHPNVSLPRNPTDAHLNPLGYAVLHPTDPPTGDVVTEGTPEQHEDGAWYQTWEVRDYTAEEAAEALERAKARKVQEINAERDRRLYPGPLPASIATVDLRSARDESNLAHLRAVARERQTVNDTTPIPFRDADNVTQMLAPANVITMTDEVLGYGQQVYATSWQLKDQLDAIYDDGALTPAEKRTQMEAVVWP